MWSVALRPVLGVAIVIVGAMGSGVWIRYLLPSSLRKFERGTVVLLGGLGVLSSVLFVVGQLCFTRTCINSILLAASVVGVTSLWTILGKRTLPSEKPVRIPKVAAAVVGLMLLLTAISGLAEVTGDWNNDAVSYHLLGPKVWLREGVIRPVVTQPFPKLRKRYLLPCGAWAEAGRQISRVSSHSDYC